MERMFCPQCRLLQPTSHRYCVRCSADLPIELVVDDTPAKKVRLFAGIKVADSDSEQAFLRVSCYLREQVFESPEGSVTIPGHHVRFSVWTGDGARCVISIPETEALDLVDFISTELGRLTSSPA